MKKIFIILILTLIPCFAQSIELPENVSEYLDKSYIGMSYNQALKQDIPFLLVFANANNLVSFAKLAPIGEMVYNEFKGQYNFCVINTKKKENRDLVKFFNPKKLPALYIIDTQEQTYTLIEKKYYKKREMREILTKFKNGTLF